MGRLTIKLPSLTSTQTCVGFSLAEIQSATKDFNDELVIGQGGFGKVYKGCICIEEIVHVVAIKRLDSKSQQGASEFRTEIEMLSKLRHSHLVSLIGYCDDNNEMILVYDYMPHGTLYHHLHKAVTPLSWEQRLKIAIGAGCGLDYLHTHGVIHRDVKSSNILLDENWAAMISDFGLSKISPTNQSWSYADASASVKGTFGYLDPEYFYTRKLTRKTDVYAFGVVLFELLSGRRAVDERNGVDHCSLVRWAQRCVKERKLDQMVDFNIRGTLLPRCLRGFAQIADRCLRSVITERPTMAEVLVSLQALLELQQRQEISAETSGINGLAWKIHKYLVPMTKQNTDQGGTSSSKNPENNMIRYNSTNKDHNYQGEMMRQHRELTVKDLKCFTYYELRHATNNLKNGKSYGKVHKGLIYEDNSRLPIAYKRLDYYKPVRQFNLKLLKEFSHPNLVEFIGYCMEGEGVFLVYEFIPNRNFHDLLRSGAVAQLPLVTKVKIAVGIARGILFLHKTQDEGSESRLDRRYILLDKDFTAKLSDFDMSKLVDGGYTQNIPDYTYHEKCYYYPGCDPSQLQSNLSGFTVVFVEVLTGKQVYDELELQNIDDYFIQHGKTSLVHIAKSCFEMCNEVDSESKMIRILEEYEQYILAPEFTTEAFENYLLERAELPLEAKVNLIEGVSGPALLECEELPLVEKMNLIEGVTRGHIFLQDTIARESSLEKLHWRSVVCKTI